MIAPAERLDRVARIARDRGLDLVGTMSSAEYDDAQPPGRRAGELMAGCDTIVLLGTGGRSAWEALEARNGEIPQPRRGHHPIDHWSSEVAHEVLAALVADGFAGQIVTPWARATLNFRQLAEMVGFGTISPVLGHLLHPKFGPWVSLRAALLLAGRPFGDRPSRPLENFEPCATCHRPCVSACPVGTYDGDGMPQLNRCADHRIGGGCAHGCDSLSACPVGAEHRYGPREFSHRQAYALFAIERWRGRRWWRFVPSFVRRRK